jgi:hypothetical protein
MAIKDEIERPIVKLIHVENGTPDPMHCIFDVEVNFKFVNGVLPYPPLKYKSDRYKIANAEYSGEELITKLFTRVQKWKIYHDILNEKQNTVDNFLDQIWSE